MKLDENKIDKSEVILNSNNTLIADKTTIDDMLYIGYVIDNKKERFIFKCISCNSIKIVSRHTILQREHLYKPFIHSFIGTEDNPRKECKINKRNQLSSLSKDFLIEEIKPIETRLLNVIFSKPGGTASKNSYSTRISIPIKFLNDMGISEEERDVIASFDGKKIIIQKK